MRAICLLAAAQVLLASAAIAGRAQDPAAGSRGDAVDEICFEDEIRDWRDLETGQLLVERDAGDWYLIEMSENCSASASQLLTIIESVGRDNCLSAGSRVDIFGGPDRQRCRFDSLYEWNPDPIAETHGGN